LKRLVKEAFRPFTDSQRFSCFYPFSFPHYGSLSSVAIGARYFFSCCSLSVGLSLETTIVRQCWFRLISFVAGGILVISRVFRNNPLPTHIYILQAFFPSPALTKWPSIYPDARTVEPFPCVWFGKVGIFSSFGGSFASPWWGGEACFAGREPLILNVSLTFHLAHVKAWNRQASSFDLQPQGSEIKCEFRKSHQSECSERGNMDSSWPHMTKPRGENSVYRSLPQAFVRCPHRSLIWTR
jgi:hypothetical protein